MTKRKQFSISAVYWKAIAENDCVYDDSFFMEFGRRGFFAVLPANPFPQIKKMGCTPSIYRKEGTHCGS